MALGTSGDGRPQPGTGVGALVSVAVPADIETLRSTRPDVAGEWRAAVGATLGGLLGEGGRVVGFDRTHGDVVARHPG